MSHKPLHILATICMAGVLIASGKGTQSGKNEGVSASRKDLTEQINNLKERIGVLETEQADLRARLERSQAHADLSEAGSELARFDCEPDFNRAHALALAQGTQGYTFEGAAAMNCTQRLAKITEKAVRTLQNR